MSQLLIILVILIFLLLVLTLSYIVHRLLNERTADSIAAHELLTATLAAVTESARRSNAELAAMMRDVLYPPTPPDTDDRPPAHIPDVPDEPFTDPTIEWLPDTDEAVLELPHHVNLPGMTEPDLTGEELDL